MVELVIIGEGKMALDCARLAVEHPGVRLAAIVAVAAADARLRAFCAKAGIELIPADDPNAPDVIGRLAALEPDLLLSINNYRILRPPLLAIPRRGAVNFHNGPLPRYAGVNIPSWVIWNGEARHGVTWHYIDEGLDTGDIIAQAHFDLDGEETASTLGFRCILEGTQMFSRVLDDLIAGRSSRQRQAPDRSYFRRNQVPNGGYLDPHWDTPTLQRFLRAMNFRPFPRPFGPLKLRTPSGDLHFDSAALEPADAASAAAVGTVLRVETDAVLIATADARLRLENGADDSGAQLALETACRGLGLAAGQPLPRAAAAAPAR